MMSNDPNIDKSQIEINKDKLRKAINKAVSVTVTRDNSNRKSLTKEDIDTLMNDISSMEYGERAEDDDEDENEVEGDGEGEDGYDGEENEAAGVDEGERPEEADEDPDDDDEDGDTRPRSYGRQCLGGWHSYAGYGHYNSSGSEWNPDDGT